MTVEPQIVTKDARAEPRATPAPRRLPAGGQKEDWNSLVEALEPPERTRPATLEDLCAHVETIIIEMTDGEAILRAEAKAARAELELKLAELRGGLEALRGLRGEAGPPGPRGPKGPAGAKGEPGPIVASWIVAEKAFIVTPVSGDGAKGAPLA
jgi:hypothetical protein